MENIEYRVVDKTGWGSGPWLDEPDKIQWQDAETKLPCLIVRGPHGALCGYVGVPEGHPLHNVEYNECPKQCGVDYCDHTPENVLEAHGGITFASGCAKITKENWEQWRKHILSPECKAQAARYPRGDAAEELRDYADCLDDYEAWAARETATHVCHVVAPGEPDNVWWFGFDCAHAGDLAPQINSLTSSRRMRISEAYRDVAYVTEHCQQLAKQLSSYHG